MELPKFAQLKGNLMIELSESDARILVQDVRQHLGGARRKMLTFRRGKGWKALGYPNLESCIRAEFGRSLSWAYRMAQQQAVLDNLAMQGISPVSEISGNALQQLAKLGADIQGAAYAVAYNVSGGNPTESTVKRAVETLQEQMVTGVFEDGDGGQVSVQDLQTGAVIERVLEAKLRNSARLTSKRNYLIKAFPASIVSTGGMGPFTATLALYQLPLDDYEKIKCARQNGQSVNISLWLESTAELETVLESG